MTKLRQMVDLDLRELDALTVSLMEFNREQLPFAAALALTRTAQAIQAEQQAQMPRRFTIRNQAVVRGIRIRRAEKRDWPLLRAEVGSIDEFMRMQELGGTKKAKGKRQGVPTFFMDRRRTKRGYTRKGEQPGELLRTGKHKAFLHEQVPGVKGSILGRPRGLSVGRGKRVALYWLVRKVHLKPRLRLRETAETTGRAVYLRIFKRSLIHALRTARDRHKGRVRRMGQSGSFRGRIK